MSAILRPIGMLKSYFGDKEEVSVQPGITIRETLLQFNMPPEIVALVLVNGEQQSKDYVLQEGDIVKLIAVIGGG
jgi:sulfur carrier protein ThiS